MSLSPGSALPRNAPWSSPTTDLPEQAVWDFDLLRGHFKELIEIDFDVELTGSAAARSQP
jgi:hypothetical protein